MDTTQHTLNTLFAQLGLPNTDADIAAFITDHSLGSTIALQDAPFWSDAQRQFLAESLAEDGAWTEIIDELDSRLR